MSVRCGCEEPLTIGTSCEKLFLNNFSQIHIALVRPSASPWISIPTRQRRRQDRNQKRGWQSGQSYKAPHADPFSPVFSSLIINQQNGRDPAVAQHPKLLYTDFHGDGEEMQAAGTGILCSPPAVYIPPLANAKLAFAQL